VAGVSGEGRELVIVQLIIGLICGGIAAAVASQKGRSPVAWFFGGFFLGLIGLVIVACLPNLKEQEAHRRRLESESRRLREQLRQERLKSEAYRQYSSGRLDAHDAALDMDTRSARALPGVEPVGYLAEGTERPVVRDDDDDGWYYEAEGATVGPVSAADIRMLLENGFISPETLLWREGLAEWLPLRKTEFGRGASV